MTSRPLLFSTLTVALAVGCSDPASPLDAGDAAPSDAAPPDASMRDAAFFDAHVADAGADASDEDAASPGDAGPRTDAGPSGPLRVFVSSVDFTGDLNGEAAGGPDAICAGLASAAGLEGNWMAWLSTATSDVVDRIEGDGPFIDMMGRTIFETRAELTAGISFTSPTFRYLQVDENGDEQTFVPVWTGNTFEATWSGVDCAGWTDATETMQGTIGIAGEATAEWNRRATLDCNDRARIYCFEQP